MAEAASDAFWLQLSLGELRGGDCLRLLVPGEKADLTVWQLLEWAFPEDAREQARVEAMLDRRANPDLPDIYAVFLDVFAQWRRGHCALFLSFPSLPAPGRDALADGGSPVEWSDPVRDRLRNGEGCPAGPEAAATFDLHVTQQYRALEYACRHGEWKSREELLEWLRSLTLLYFLDKHRLPLAINPAGQMEGPLAAIAGPLLRDEIIVPSPDSGAVAITSQGRQLIGEILAETEGYIDQYDVFQDVAYDGLADTLEFGSGRGMDLRVQVFLAEGLDPVRVVFLLRLYDGTLDQFTSSWQRQIGDPEFFDRILEPAVNHDQVDESVIDRVIEGGLAYGDAQREAARLQQVQEDIRADLDRDAG